MKRELRILYSCFDQVPSFKGSSSHILASCRQRLMPKHVHLLSLGEYSIPSHKNFQHTALQIPEKNYLKRAQIFQNHIENKIAEIQFDIAHFRGPWEGVKLIQSGRPCVYEVNSLPSFELPYLFGEIPEEFMSKLKQQEFYCLKHAQKIIVPAQKIKHFLEVNFGSEISNKIEVLPNGCDLIPTSPPHYNGDKLKLVYIGTLHSWQGLHWMMKAMKELPQVELDIYASSQKKWLKPLVKNIRKYKLHNQVKIKDPLHKGNLHSTLAQYHFGMAPLLKVRRNKIQGCCPVKIKDYLAAGIPVISSDLEVTRELLTPNENSLLFTPNRLSELREILEDIKNNKSIHQKLVNKVIQGQSEIYTWDHYINDLDTLYQNLV